MDLTTLFAALAMAFGLLTFETIRHADRVVVEVADLPSSSKVNVDRATVEQEFAAHLHDIARVHSVVVPTEIRTDRERGVGMAIASALKIDGLAHALEGDLGYTPDRLRLALFNEGGELHAVVSGRGKFTGLFRQVLVPMKDETLLNFVKRCSLVGAARLAPYRTTLYLIDEGTQTGDFTRAITLANAAVTRLPNTPISPERSLFENLLGVAALFKHDEAGARSAFQTALKSNPDSVVAALNLAFIDIQMNNYAAADELMRTLLDHMPPANAVLLSTAYMTQAAAQMGLHQPLEADRLLELATQANPDNSSAFELWSAVKEVLGDTAAAKSLHKKALDSSDAFENYAEVATLYFRLSWADDAPLSVSPFRNPEIVTFR